VGVIFLLGSAFTIWMAVEAVRRGQASAWLWIILVFGPVGAAVYFFSEYIDLRFSGSFGGLGRTVSAGELRVAEAEVHRLDNAVSWLGYASALRARKQYPRAVEAARNAVERDASSVDAHYELAQSLIATGRGAEAVESLQQVIATDRSFDSEAALFALAKIHLKSGDFEAARAELEEIANRSSRPEYLYELAVALGKLGHREEAAHVLQRIIGESAVLPPYLKRSAKPWVSRSRQALRHLGF